MVLKPLPGGKGMSSLKVVRNLVAVREAAKKKHRRKAWAVKGWSRLKRGRDGPLPR